MFGNGQALHLLSQSLEEHRRDDRAALGDVNKKLDLLLTDMDRRTGAARTAALHERKAELGRGHRWAIIMAVLTSAGTLAFHLFEKLVAGHLTWTQ